MKGLLVDFGGVLTTNVFDSFRAFCVDEGLDPDAIKRLFREHPEALRLVRGLETGDSSEEEFGERFGELLGIERRGGLVERRGHDPAAPRGAAGDRAPLDARQPLQHRRKSAERLLELLRRVVEVGQLLVERLEPLLERLYVEPKLLDALR
jgi:hypothetical protein